MIQEKDFLYRVPVKTAPITTPGGQIRNPEILVDVEGGEFMRGNILDANSTNKLINQSVKDAVDNKLIEGGYVTKDLLEAETTRATEQENSLKTLIGAETSARTKGDEDLSSKIKAEQTRAEGKEKEISDKLAIVNGDSNTEGSFRKAIADVVAAAPEDLDTLKEIADKLAGNDDLHTALNQAITEKADASALLNEVSRATGVENNLKTAIDGKQPKGNYLTEHQSLEEYAKKTDIPEIDTSDFVSKTATNAQDIMSELTVRNRLYVREKSNPVYTSISYLGISVYGDLAIPCIKSDGVVVYKRNNHDEYTKLDKDFVCARDRRAEMRASATFISSWELDESEPSGLGASLFYLDEDGVRLLNGDNNHVLTSHGSTIDITQYAKKSELPAIPTKTSQLTNDSNFITTADVDLTPYATTQALTAVEQKVTANTTAIEGKQDKGNYMEYSSKDDDGYTINCEFNTSEPITVDEGSGFRTFVNQSGITANDDNNRKTSQLSASSLTFTAPTNTDIVSTIYTINGIVARKYTDCLATSDGSFKPISDFVLKEEEGAEYVAYDEFASVKAGLNKKQNRITVNRVDVTDLETADITQLRAIVKNLLTALDNSGLIIIRSQGLE